MPQKQKHSDLSDEELLGKYRSTGDNEWLGILLQRYTLLLLGVGLKYLKDRSAAEDAVQHIFEKTLKQLPPGTIHNFKGWLYVLLKNHCLQILRSKKIYFSDAPLDTLSQDEEPLNEIRQKEATLAEMERSLDELNADQRCAIELFYLKKMSYQQIMEQTGYSFMQVKSHIQNGKRNLKLILNKKLGR